MLIAQCSPWGSSLRDSLLHAVVSSCLEFQSSYLVHVQLMPSEMPSQPSELETKGTLNDLNVCSEWMKLLLFLHHAYNTSAQRFKQVLDEEIYLGTCPLECSGHQTTLPRAYFLELNVGFNHPILINFASYPFQTSNIIHSCLKMVLVLAHPLRIPHSQGGFLVLMCLALKNKICKEKSRFSIQKGNICIANNNPTKLLWPLDWWKDN